MDGIRIYAQLMHTYMSWLQLYASHSVHEYFHTDNSLGTFKVSDELHTPSDFSRSMLA